MKWKGKNKIICSFFCLNVLDKERNRKKLTLFYFSFICISWGDNTLAGFHYSTNHISHTLIFKQICFFMCESFTKSIIALWLIPTLNKRLFVKDPNPSVIRTLSSPIKCHLLIYELVMWTWEFSYITLGVTHTLLGR